jgi:CPA2 family monovalent cation:H+ antiporter-2
MAGESAVADYTEVVLFLATAGVVVPIFRRFRLSPVLAFLGAGVALEPFGWVPCRASCRGCATSR